MSSQASAWDGICHSLDLSHQWRRLLRKASILIWTSSTLWANQAIPSHFLLHRSVYYSRCKTSTQPMEKFPLRRRRSGLIQGSKDWAWQPGVLKDVWRTLEKERVVKRVYLTSLIFTSADFYNGTPKNEFSGPWLALALWSWLWIRRH